MLILNRPKVGAAGGALGTACLPGGKEPSWASPLTSSVLFCRLSRAALPPRPAHHEISIPSTKRPPAGSNSPRRKSRPANEEEFGSCREWKGRSSVTPPGSPSLGGETAIIAGGLRHPVRAIRLGYCVLKTPQSDDRGRKLSLKKVRVLRVAERDI
jgi:hypothetical protein